MKIISPFLLASAISYYGQGKKHSGLKGGKSHRQAWNCRDCKTQYADYLALFGKSYMTQEEWEMRYGIFKHHLRMNTFHNLDPDNQGADDTVLGLNVMSDWTRVEYVSLLQGEQFSPTPSPPTPTPPSPPVGGRRL